jgi:hypothetical protein
MEKNTGSENAEDLSIRQIVRITGLTYYEAYKA